MTTEQSPAETATPGTAAPARSFTHTIERKPGSIVSLNVEVDADRLQRASERALQKHLQHGKIPGFRPGKAPRPLYERTYCAEQLWDDAAADMVDKTFQESSELASRDCADQA